MHQEVVPGIVRPFLNQRVIVQTFEGVKVKGDLVQIDKSVHEGLGNVIIHNNGRLIIIRGDALRCICSHKRVERFEKSTTA